MKLHIKYISKLWSYLQKLMRSGGEGYLLVGKFFVAVLMVMGSVKVGRGQEIKPLKIGDTIPDALWNMPMQVVNHPGGKEIIRMSDFKGKVLILDFWSTNCGACIAGFPKMIGLQSQYSEKLHFLPVTYQGGPLIKKVLKENDYFTGLRNAVVINDVMLKQYFKHLTIPHVVWIDPRGIVRAFTTAHHVLPVYIDELLMDKKSHWATKVEDTLAIKNPILQPSFDRSKSQPYYYSTVTTYLQGIPLYRVTQTKNESDGTITTRFANNTIFEMYLRALKRFGRPIHSSLVLYEGCLADDIRYNPNSNISIDNWMEAKGISYEIRIKKDADRTAVNEKMLADLNFYLGMKVQFENRLMDCLKLKIIDRKKFERASSREKQQKASLINDKPKKTLRNHSVKQLVDVLNYLGYHKPVKDETDNNLKVDMDLIVTDLLDIEELNKELQKYGLAFISGVGQVNMLVFSKMHGG